jgi:N utilization substance protein B
MTSKRKIRELALQLLFVWDAHGQRCDEEMTLRVTHDASDDPVTRMRAVEMAAGAWDAREATDRWVERLAPQWPPRRQPGVDRNILRMAVWELTGADTPPKVVIDEAIELAKIYSTENSPAFVNGVLDAVLREHKTLMGSPNDETRNPNE